MTSWYIYCKRLVCLFVFNKCIHLKLKSVPMLQEAYYSHFIMHCVKRVRIQSYSGSHFRIWSISSYSVRIRKNADQNNSKYGHFSHSDNLFLSYAVTLTSLRRARFVELQVSWTMTLTLTPQIHPSEIAIQFHALRIYLQVCQWSTLDLEF